MTNIKSTIKDFLKNINILRKWQNFAKSGHTDPDQSWSTIHLCLSTAAMAVKSDWLLFEGLNVPRV